ncbi:MAG: DNA-directed RNA polymerase subunit D [Candidatus Woesearchaeota archaeon]|jgi:DNA-directed RNA polymerase subunit D
MIVVENEAENEGDEYKMEIKNVHTAENLATFTLTKTTPAYVNSLRRAVISLVPSLAIEDVQIYENNSALYDEIVALRLGLLPLTTDLKSYELPESYDTTTFTAASSVKLSLEAQGPCTVTADQLVTKDPKVVCAFPKMPIVLLLKGQSIKLEATAVLGQGKTHYKWAPGTAYYQHVPVVNKKDVLPKDLAEKKSQEVLDEDATTKEDEFIFTIESWGQLSPKDIMVEALTQLNTELSNISKLAEGLK